MQLCSSGQQKHMKSHIVQYLVLQQYFVRFRLSSFSFFFARQNFSQDIVRGLAILSCFLDSFRFSRLTAVIFSYTALL